MIRKTFSGAWRSRLLGRLATVAGLAMVPIVGHADNYVPDPTWNGGQIGPDNFAAGDFSSRRGQKIVTLDNGDVVVAGVVPGVGGAAGHTKMGLVRYNRQGVRQVWSNAGANGFNGNQYVITPCTSTIASRCGDVLNVDDIQRFGQRVFVLADTEDYAVRLVGNPPVPVWYARPRVDVYVFGTDGALQGIATADADSYAADNSRTVLGGGLALYDNNSFPTVTTLVYAGTGIVDGIYRPRFARFTVANDSSLNTEVAAMEPSFGNFCLPGHFCQLGGITVGGRTSLMSPPRIYIAGSSFHGDPDPGTIGWPAGWDMFVASVNISGTPRSSFGTNGAYPTEGLVGSSQSSGLKIAVVEGSGALSQDEVFVAGNVDFRCRSGIAVLKLGQDGTPASTFGSAGKITYGGSDQSDDIACINGWRQQSIRADYSTDMVVAGGKVAVSGFNIYGPGVLCIVGQPCPEDNVDGEVAVIDGGTGAIESWRGYAYSDTSGGARSRHTGFWGITANGDQTFSMAGDVRYFNNASVPAGQRGKQMFATLRIAPLGDTIFKAGFEQVVP